MALSIHDLQRVLHVCYRSSQSKARYQMQGTPPTASFLLPRTVSLRGSGEYGFSPVRHRRAWTLFPR